MLEILSTVTGSLPREYHPELEPCPGEEVTGSQAVLRATRVWGEAPILEEEQMFLDHRPQSRQRTRSRSMPERNRN